MIFFINATGAIFGAATKASLYLTKSTKSSDFYLQYTSGSNNLLVPENYTFTEPVKNGGTLLGGWGKSGRKWSFLILAGTQTIVVVRTIDTASAFLTLTSLQQVVFLTSGTIGLGSLKKWEFNGQLDLGYHFGDATHALSAGRLASLWIRTFYKLRHGSVFSVIHQSQISQKVGPVTNEVSETGLQLGFSF